MKNTKRKKVSYAKWGYIFLLPFFVVYFLFSFIPLVNTFWNSLFENYMSGLNQVGPTFVGLENFKALLTPDLLKYAGNTLIMWLMGFVPQIIVSLLLAVWLTDSALKIKGKGFFKTVIYMPNIIMAAAFSMLFFALFSDIGPINGLLENMGIIREPIRFMSDVWWTRGLIALIGFLMWFGNTTILLMAAVLGVDTAVYEAARLDGASSWKIFTQITVPLIRPVLAYVFITSMIGGIQSFDVPQILTGGSGGPNRTSMTLIMYLNNLLFNTNYGLAGALSVILFIATAILSIFVFQKMTGDIVSKKERSK